jgi:putative RNA 2'-phosphotransferase
VTEAINPRQVVKLSKLMSYALRHNPASLNLELDQDGWVALEALVTTIAARPEWRWVRAEHIQDVIDNSDKQRFEIRGTMIRARYGHSRAARPSYQPVKPPPVLYHGTPQRNLPTIRRHGLQAMSRQYVHLSATPEMALQVGRRRDPHPALLLIRAAEAHAAGWVFGAPSGSDQDDVFLIEAVPPEFIEFPGSE